MTYFSNDSKKRLLKFLLLGKEFKFEISYSEKYYQKIKAILNYFPPQRKS